MVGLLSRRFLAPYGCLNPYYTLAIPAQLQASSEPPQVLLDVSATTNLLDATVDAVENRMVKTFEPVIDPAAFALLFHQTGGLHQPQVLADIGLRGLKGVHHLANAETASSNHQATGQAQTQTLPQRGEQLLRFSYGEFHICAYSYL